MHASSTATATPAKPTNFKRLFFIVAIGLGSINIALAALAVLADREQQRAFSTQATVDRFHILFYNNPNAWPRNRWMGIETHQNPNDVWITQEILFEVKPDFVVETGSFKGGSAVMYATILREINPAGRVITIDVQDFLDDARKLPIFAERVEFLLGSSTDARIVEQVRRRVAGRSVVVILDSDHRKSHVLNELHAYAGLVQPGGYIIVNDSNINGHPVIVDPNGIGGVYAGKPGPTEAVWEFVSSDGRFKIDRDRERLMLTMSPNGFLKRVQ